MAALPHLAPAAAALPSRPSLRMIRPRRPSRVYVARRGAPVEFATASDLEFESPLRIVEYPDPVLRARNRRIKADAFGSLALRRLAEEMFDVMYKTDGIGLSAPQVGVNVEFMVFNPSGERGMGEEMVLVNPVLFRASQRMNTYEEGCLSFPGIHADVERPASIKIEARDLNGAKFRINLSGLSARIFQHEFDHLQGILFIDRMSGDVLDSIREDLKRLEKKYEDQTSLPSPERVDSYKGRKEFTGFGKR